MFERTEHLSIEDLQLKNKNVDWSSVQGQLPITLPDTYDVYDFTKGYDPNRKLENQYGIGKYAEKRSGMYTGELYESQEVRDHHMGIDVGCPVGEPVLGFADGLIHAMGYLEEQWDYGATIITRHQVGNDLLYALHGHLSLESLNRMQLSQPFKKGDTIGFVGDNHENGGWNSHLHFQLSWLAPKGYDIPGVVKKSELEYAKLAFPDPQFLFGKLYD